MGAPPASAAPAPTPSAAATQPPAGAMEAKHPRMGHHAGMAGPLMMSLESVELKPDQKAVVQGIENDLEKLGEKPQEAGRALAVDLADGVAAGKLNRAKTDADVRSIAKAVEGIEPGIQDAANRLHKTLDPAQRKKLVETMRARGQEMHGMHEHGMAGHGAAPEKHGAGGHAEGGPLGKLGEALALTAEQREKLKAKLETQFKAKEPAMKDQKAAAMKHMSAIGDAFEKDQFDAKKVGLATKAPDMAKMMANQRIAFVEAVLAVLTPEQRPKFAAHIREHAGDVD
jgi:Spy/CpxP family protein refolding chaperone